MNEQQDARRTKIVRATQPALTQEETEHDFHVNCLQNKELDARAFESARMAQRQRFQPNQEN